MKIPVTISSRLQKKPLKNCICYCVKWHEDYCNAVLFFPRRNSSSMAQRNRPPSPSSLKQRPPSPTVTQKPVPISRPSLTPSVLSTTKKTAEPETKPKEKSTDVASSEPKTPQASEKEAASSKTKDGNFPVF